MRCRVLMIFAVLLCLAAAPASAQSIGVYFDPSGSIDCAGAIPPLTPATWYICARLFGPAANGIIGVEFRQALNSAAFDRVLVNDQFQKAMLAGDAASFVAH